MGRPNILPDNREAAIKLRMVKLRFVDHAYDQGGAYWGVGNPLYWAEGEDTRVFVRASSRDEAKAKVRTYLPAAIFHR